VQKTQMDQLLSHGVQLGSSDIHFKVGSPPAYRIDGTLRPVKYPNLGPADTRTIVSTILGTEPDSSDVAEIQEHDTSYSIPGVARFRVNLYRQRGSLCLVLRVIPTAIPSVQELGLPERVSGLAEEARGLVLVTGATGSGKSSTLAAMIDHINATRPVHVLTIEDPIEFLYSNKRAQVSQREVGPDTRSFTTALRAALRQDPDVILVGEMRDPETIDIALKAAETGHMVFSTVHTTDAAKTIGRLIGVFPPEEQQNVRIRLADNLRGVISQRLLPRADGKGRVVAAEILIATATVQDHIKDSRDTGALRELIERGGDQYGMQTFDQHLHQLYAAGAITIDVAKAASTSPGDFQQELDYGSRSSYSEDLHSELQSDVWDPNA